MGKLYTNPCNGRRNYETWSNRFLCPISCNNGVLGCDVHYNTANTDDFFNGGALTPNAWYNIIVIKHPTGATVLYVNGQAVANSTKVDHLLNTGTAGAASRLLMGATPLSDVAQSEYFPGLLMKPEYTM